MWWRACQRRWNDDVAGSYPLFCVQHVVVVVSGVKNAEMIMLQGHKNWVQIVSWSPDAAMLASGDQNGVIWLWQPKTGETLGACRGGWHTHTHILPVRPPHLAKHIAVKRHLTLVYTIQLE